MAKGVVTGSLISVFINDDMLFPYFANELELILTGWMHQHMDPKAKSVTKVPGDWSGRLIGKLRTKVTQNGSAIHIEMGLLDGNKFEIIRALTLDTGSSPMGKAAGESAMNVHEEFDYIADGHMVGHAVPGKEGRGWLTETEGELMGEIESLVRQALINAALRASLGSLIDVQGHHVKIKMKL